MEDVSNQSVFHISVHALNVVNFDRYRYRTHSPLGFSRRQHSSTSSSSSNRPSAASLAIADKARNAGRSENRGALGATPPIPYPSPTTPTSVARLPPLRARYGVLRRTPTHTRHPSLSTTPTNIAIRFYSAASTSPSPRSRPPSRSTNSPAKARTSNPTSPASLRTSTRSTSRNLRSAMTCTRA